MKKQPTKKDLVMLLFSGLGMLSFGILFAWWPPVCFTLLFFGAVLIILVLVTVATILYEKIVK